MPRVGPATVIRWRCPNFENGCYDPRIWETNGKQTWDRHKAKGDCVPPDTPDKRARIRVPNPNRIVVVNINNSPNATVNLGPVTNLTIIKQTLVLPAVVPLGSQEEVVKGLQWSEETLCRMLDHELPDSEDPRFHLAIVEYVKEMACGPDVQYSNIRLPDKGKPDELHVLKQDGLHMLTGRKAYIELIKNIIPILCKIFSEGKIMGEADFAKVADLIDGFLDKFDNPDEPFTLTMEEIKEIRAGILLALREDSLRKQKLRIPARLSAT